MITNTTKSPSQLFIVGVTVYVTVPELFPEFIKVCAGIVFDVPLAINPVILELVAVQEYVVFELFVVKIISDVL